jgi:hypothetical protein
MGDCKTMADHIPSLVEGVKGTLSNPENPAAQLNLINASEQFLQVCEWPSGYTFPCGKHGSTFKPPGHRTLMSARMLVNVDITSWVACTVCPVFLAYMSSQQEEFWKFATGIL